VLQKGSLFGFVCHGSGAYVSFYSSARPGLPRLRARKKSNLMDAFGLLAKVPAGSQLEDAFHRVETVPDHDVGALSAYAVPKV
jgi:hypothetical protein